MRAVKNIKVLLDFFPWGNLPPVCLRVSPGLLRHNCGPASCHTSSMAAKLGLALTQNSSPTSMAAKLGLALTQNSSPTPLANRRRVAQIAVSKGRAFGRPPQRAKYPIVPSARRNGRNSRPTAMAPVAAPRGWTAGAIYCDVIHSMRGASRMPRPAVGDTRRPPPATR